MTPHKESKSEDRYTRCVSIRNMGGLWERVFYLMSRADEYFYYLIRAISILSRVIA